MCTANCTWKDSLEIDLYPWDAGTNSRVTYMGEKMETHPRERIHRLTSTRPNDRDSPFYGVDIKPFARLTMRKKKEACTDDDGKSASAEESPTTEELVSMMKKKMMMNKKFEMEKCATSQWSDWAECSNPCGSGFRERRRMLKNSDITAEMCDLELVETETCIGDCKVRGKKLRDDFIMRHDVERDPTDTCAVTDWSVWSPCSATCGLGMKERWRMFLYNPEQRVDCGIHLMEKDLCRGEIFDCQKAMMMKNFTAICQLPVDVGPCRGDFPRWFYNRTMQKCQTFSYGGCRGNENRFDTESECVDLCADHMASLHRNGGLGGKRGMSQQQREMERVMMREKERMMAKQRMREKQETMKQDMLRKEEMMRKLRMMEQQREEQERKAEEMKRQMMKKQMMLQNHGQADGGSGGEDAAARMEREKAKMMRRQQRLMKKKQMMERRRRRRRRQRKDDDGVTGGSRRQSGGARVNCMVTPWSGWSECSATCGRGVIMKTRMVKVEPKNGGRRCPRRLVKKKKCRQKKCPVDCKMSQWSEWSTCTQTCGDSSVQIRRRRRLRKPRRGGLACSTRKERRFCNVPLCPDSDVRS
ncbi:spondin-1-like [Elysia marginata]|uniref:Spondin-1-like n=1 Tax=Elysia marginata TaxID=1093978 RepID=A0AAV4J7D8_9GAST|nr:spondin-1-like [Elysia marginata]